MKTIDIDASHWTTPIDLYDSILSSVGAPKEHGRSVNALVDSMVWGGMNAVEQPYVIRLHAKTNLPAAVLREVEIVKQALSEACDEARGSGKNVQVAIDTRPIASAA